MGARIIDVSNPLNPVESGALENLGVTIWELVSRLTSVNPSDPGTPLISGHPAPGPGRAAH